MVFGVEHIPPPINPKHYLDQHRLKSTKKSATRPADGKQGEESLTSGIEVPPPLVGRPSASGEQKAQQPS